VQTTITIAYPLSEVYGDDHAALNVLSKMIDFTVSNVRHQLGVSYGVGVRVATDRPRIELRGPLDSGRAGEGLAAIHAAIQRLRDGEEFARQFAFARRSVVSDLIDVQSDPQLLASQLAVAVRNGRSYEYFQALTRRVARLTPQDIRAQIDRVLRDDRAVTLIQGPAAGVRVVLEHNKITGARALPDVVHDEHE
jgi:predicted Zn-dependent peptidase